MARVVTIQNVDRVVHRKDYEHLAGNELLVTSVFRTVQGEGPFAGHPAVFLRLAGCNFGNKSPEGMCSFCDTSFQFDQGKVYTFEELTMAIYSLAGYSKSDILVITGGEPTLQPALLDWIETATDMFKRVQIETNGTQVAFFKQLDDLESSVDGLAAEEFYVRPSIVVSPKASMKAQRYAEPSELVKQYASCFKFVVTADETDPHHVVPQWALDLMWLGRCAVYVSPMAVYKKPYQGEVSSAWDHELIDPVETAKNYAYAAKYALENNLLLSIQQHLFLGVA